MNEDGDPRFGDDAPKKSPTDDQLNYAPFAQRIADAIVRLDAPGGYVIGLHGKWGSGKSTVLNFVQGYLAEHNARNSENRITTIEFRPWLIAGDHDVIAAYFKVLSEALGSPTKKRWRHAPLRLFRKDKSRLLFDAATKMSLAVLDPSGTALASTLALTAADTAGQLSKQMHESPSLQKAYEEFRKKLRDSDQRFLVLIDDIDRLKNEDVKSIMQMVKSVGQLPNVVYLLAYDREIVWAAFGRNPIRAEPSFAEKIVQQELQLPLPSQTSLLNMLFAELSFLFEGIDGSLRWGYILQDGLHRWIRSPRDVIRLSNAVKFSWPALKGEIDPRDLLAMEGLRLFDFKVFEWLRDHRDYLFTKGRFQFANEGLKAQTARSLQKTVSEAEWSQIRPLLIQIFPQIPRDPDDVLSVNRADPDEIRKQRGVGSEAGFDSYFGLYPSPNAIPLATLKELVSGDQTTKSIEDCLRDFLKRKNSQDTPLIGELLYELLIRYQGASPTQPKQELLDALFAVGDELIDIDYWPGEDALNLRVLIDALIREMLCRWGPNEAGMRLVEAFEGVDSPAFLADVYVSRGRELGVFPADSRDDCPIREGDFEQLGQTLVAKIHAAFNNKSLHQAPYYYNIARAWGHLVNSEEPRSWLMQGVVQSDKFMAKACHGLVGTHWGGTGKHRFEMMEQPDSEFYDIETLRAAGRAHQNSETLTDDERYRIAAVTRGCEKLLTNNDRHGTNQTT
ncbi:MAG: P-loop NTPase fold protein [Gammaproteobacteria bacterium]|nr:P-loop NTPase fold protein [Gammaproteobacteria bacterium]